MEFLFVIFAAVAALIVGIMLFFNYLATYYRLKDSKRRLAAIDQGSPYKKRKPPPVKPTKETLSKDRGLEKLKEEREVGVTKYNPESQELENSRDNQVIVGVAKPVGIWTKFIMKQKIGFIIAMGGLQNNNKGGFWTNLIKAQASSRGKGHGKGR
jgi:hypothetical protein